MRRIGIPIALLLAAPLAGAASDPAPVRTLERSFAVAGVREVSIEAREGAIRWSAGGDAIAVRVDLGPTRHRGARADLARLELSETHRDGVLGLDVGSGVPGAFAERWTVTVPKSLAARVRLKEGDVRIEGAEGGVTLDLGVGDAAVTVPSGAVSASVGVGDLDVAHGAPGAPDAELHASVGHVSLWVDGARLDHAGAPGSGDRLALRREGGARLRLSANVGDVTLRIR